MRDHIEIVPVQFVTYKISEYMFMIENGSFQKTSIPPQGGNRKLTPLPPSDVLIRLLLSETIFSPLLLRTAEISSGGGGGGVWIFSGTTQYQKET